ncbi:unnamed protein product [Rotaria socialis]|uniref:Uncharacterized protein n=3 Tax=Rotaria socialis TaxID=392032 RepID=A0A818BR56_9BILA|nr:unnamed protein product [Rotaria socialis]
MKKTVGQLQQNFKLSDLKVLFERLFPSPPNGKLEDYRFIVNGIDLNIQNESEFNKNKHLIINGSTLYPLQRCVGGSDVDMVTLKNIVRNELPSEVGKILKVMAQCAAHGETTLCVALCCYKYCAGCFIRSFEASKFKLECLGCKKAINYMEFFKSPDFIQTLDCLDQISTLPKHIDYQVCSCGSPMVNETMYAKQQCMQLGEQQLYFYDKLVVPLLRQMLNLEELSLKLSAIIAERSYIDGNQLYEQALKYLPRLNKFMFNIHAHIINTSSIEIDLPSNDDIRNSFIKRGFQSVGTCATKPLIDNVGDCHVYSLPYLFDDCLFLSNCFQGGQFNKVRMLMMRDRYPFEEKLF